MAGARRPTGERRRKVANRHETDGAPSSRSARRGYAEDASRGEGADPSSTTGQPRNKRYRRQAKPPDFPLPPLAAATHGLAEYNDQPGGRSTGGAASVPGQGCEPAAGRTSGARRTIEEQRRAAVMIAIGSRSWPSASFSTGRGRPDRHLAITDLGQTVGRASRRTTPSAIRLPGGAWAADPHAWTTWAHHLPRRSSNPMQHALGQQRWPSQARQSTNSAGAG